MASTESATKTLLLTAEPLTPEAFAPFGVVLTPQGHDRLPINTYGDRLDIYREPFESDQPIEWFIVQAWLREMRVLYLERHNEITQAFVPLGGNPFVTVVAPPGVHEEDGVPALDAVRAFVVPGNVGIQLHRSTWHENPLPLVDGQVILVSSHQSLTRGQQANPDKRLDIYALDVEKRNLTERGVALHIEAQR